MAEPIIIASESVIHLRAVDAERNIFREYHLYRSLDLFNVMIVDTWWGRIGSRGHHLRRSFADVHHADAYVRSVLTRRATATKRIGVAYRAADALNEQTSVSQP